MKGGLLKAAVVVALMGMTAGAALAAGSHSGGPANAPVNSGVINPYSPAFGHNYRHGVIPTLAVHQQMQEWAAQQGNPGIEVATGQQTLSYGGGTGGVGVLSGQSKVYLVFYGTQWGTSSTDANGNLKFSNDAAGAAGAAQQMFKGIGTASELWSAELTQWCDGAGVSSGAVACPASGASYIPYQQNIFAGAWYDNTQASPTQATAAQLGNEANAAALHFGNTTAASNRYTYYVILSPKGTNPDDYQNPNTGYCAWHDYSADAGSSTPYGQLAFSNQPYNIDAGTNCGVGFVNSPGTLDGYTMTLGHEWHEMMSDQFPAGGWTNHVSGSSYNGQENSDECAWISPGSTGGAANITFATGTFAEQASWSNDTNSCAISHAIVNHGGGGGGGQPTANFSFVTNGLVATFTDSSTDSGGTITSRSWTFGDGGTSTATNPSHTYAAAGTYSVTETANDSASGLSSSKTSSVTVSGGGGGGTVLTNGVPVTGLSATTGNNTAVYTLVVPAGATNLKFVTSGNNGDADLYVKFGSAPTLSSYDCRPYTSSPSETCTFATPQVGTYYVMVNAYASFTGLSLTGSYSTGGGGGGGSLTSGVPVTGLAAATGSWSTIYTLVVPSGKTKVTFTITGSTGDADLYVRIGAAPTLSTYNCRPYLTGDNETCTFNAPAAGTYYVGVEAYQTYSGVTLTGTIQ
jgi:serine protease